jgi:hypothetical protein
VGVRRHRWQVCAGLVVLCAAWLPASQADAANSPTFRDCSFIAGIDPDFVQLSGVGTGPGGTLAVGSAQRSVTVEASESSDPFDNLGHVALSVTVSGTGTTPRTVSGTAVGAVTLSVPLSGVAGGGHYTLNWFAEFDNGGHACPSTGTPQNTPANTNPFVLNVLAGAPQPLPPPPPPPFTLVGLAGSHGTWRPAGIHHASKKARRAPVGTKFSFDLSEPAGVTLSFTQSVPGRRRAGRCVKAGAHARGRRCTRSVPRGSFSLIGVTGTNTVPFNGRIGGSRLPAGNYVLRLTATSGAGQSITQSLRFTIVS